MDNKEMPLISIIILNYNGKGFLEDCLESLLKSDYPDFEVILVDNASTDDSLICAEMVLRKDSRLKIIKNDKNLLFTGGNNLGIKQARGEYIIILNNDTEVERSWLKEIAVAMQDESIGAAQPKILVYKSVPLRIDYAGGDLDRYGYAEGRGRGYIDKGQFDSVEEIFYAGGTAMILRKKALDEVGLFDDKFGAHWEDTDLSWRIRLRGYRIVIIPKSIVYHKGSMSMTKFAKRQDIAWHIRKNRIAGLIKNYDTFNLINTLPVLIIIYSLVFMKEAILDKDIKVAMSSILAIAWNIRESEYIFRQRKIVQHKIRRVSDRQVAKFMERRFIAFKFFREQLCL